MHGPVSPLMGHRELHITPEYATVAQFTCIIIIVMPDAMLSAFSSATSNARVEVH